MLDGPDRIALPSPAARRFSAAALNQIDTLSAYTVYTLCIKFLGY
jgi:hypothetical protein